MKPVRYDSADLESILDEFADQLGKKDQDRLSSLLPLFKNGEASLGECATLLFGDAENTGGLKAFTSFRGRVNQAAKDAGREDLKFEADTAKKTDPSERRCWFTGPDLAEESIERAVRDQTGSTSRLPAEEENPAVIVSSDDLDEPFVEWAAVVSSDEADHKLARPLLDQLEKNLQARQGIAYRRIRQDPLRAQVLIPLLSPSLCNDSEARRILARARSQRTVVTPALLQKTGANQQCPELDQLQTFRLQNAKGDSLAFSQCQANARKEDFAFEFFQQIDERVTIQLDFSDSGQLPLPLKIDDWPEEFARQQTEKGRLEAEAENPATLMGLERIEARNVDDLEPDGDAAQLLRKWALNPNGRPFFAVLGEYGIGKTTCLKRFARQLNEERAAARKTAKGRKPKSLPPLAIYLDLRDFPTGDGEDRVPALELLLEKAIGQVWQSPGSERHCAGDILKKVREEGAILIFDGLDERTVHMTTSEAQRFIRQLWRALPPSAFDEKLREEEAKKHKTPGRLVISCRSHYFRTVREQRSLFLGEQREGLKDEDYQALIVLPFRDEQVRDYLRQVVEGDGEKLESMLAAIDSIHNLEELSHRPVLLDLIARQISALEQRKARGETVRAVTLYDEMVQEWLLRDTGKHHFKSDHKCEIMEHLAAAMWRGGSKEWKIDKAEEWLGDLLENLPHVKRRVDRDKIASELLEEDFRTATFIVRPGENRFRFAHTSFQEYFLARHLRRALDGHRASEAWDLPLPSLETLEFFGEILACENHPEIPSRLGELLSGGPKDARRNAFRYWLMAAETRLPEPLPAGPADLSGCDLADWKIGRPEGMLDLRGAIFTGADLRNTRFENADFSGADLSGVRCCRVEFHSVKLRDARAIKTDFRGAVFRGGDLSGIHGEGIRWRSAWVVDTEVSASFPNEERENRPIVAPKTFHPLSHQWLRADGTVGVNRGHSNWVNACGFSPDGSLIVSGSSDHQLKLWDADSGRCIQTFRGHSSRVNACGFSPNGLRIVSSSYDNSLKLWDAESGRCLQTLQGHSSRVNACGFSPDGSRIVSGSDDHSLKLWDAEGGRCVQTLQGHSSRVLACSFSPDDSRIVSGSSDHSLKLWDAESGRCVKTLPGHSNSVFTCGFSSDSSRIVSGSSDNSLKLWDAEIGRCLQTLRGHSHSVLGCGFSLDGSRIVSGSSDNSLKLWDAESGHCLQTLQGHSDWVWACGFSPDDSRIVSGSSDCSLKLWDAESGRCLQTLLGHSNRVGTCSFSSDGSRIVSGFSDNRLKLWDAQSGRRLQILQGHSGPVRTCGFSPDGSRIVSGSSDHMLKLWDAQSGRCLQTLQDHSGSVNACGFSPDGTRIVSGSDDNMLKLWDAQSGRRLQTFKGHSGSVNACGFSPDGSRIVSGSSDNSLKLWDAKGGPCLQTLHGHFSYVNACGFSPDGTRIVSGSSDNSFKLWDAETRRFLKIFQGHSGSVRTCGFSLDGTRIVSGSDDNMLKLWDAQSGLCLQTLQGHFRPVNACGFSPDGATIVSGSNDGSVRIWDAESGKELLQVWHGKNGEMAAIDSEGRLVSATEDAWRLVHWTVWDEEAKRLVALPLEYFGIDEVDEE